MEVQGLVGKLGSELRCSRLPQGQNVVNKDLFLPALIVESFIKVTHEWALAARSHLHLGLTYKEKGKK